MIETHVQRMNRLIFEHEISRRCRADDLTFGNRCLNCGHTPHDHKATLFSPSLEGMYK